MAIGEGKLRGYQAGLVVCVVIIVVLGFSYVSANQNFTSQINALSADKASLQNQVNSLTSDKTGLQKQINLYSAWLSGNITLLEKYKTWLSGNVTKYESQISSLQSEIASLNAIITTLKAPKIVKVNLQSEDVNKPWVGGSYLKIYGEVCNVGTNTANNCRLHVVAYQGGVVAIDTYIVLGAINGESWVTVNESVYYVGGALTSWTITPEWTS